MSCSTGMFAYVKDDAILRDEFQGPLGIAAYNGAQRICGILSNDSAHI